MRRRFLFGTVLAISAAVLFSAKATYASCQASSIVIDGEYEDWAECPSLVNDNAGDATNLQYWDEAAQTWTLTDPGYITWTFDDGAMMDVTNFKMLNDDQYMYLNMTNSWPMMSMKAPDGEFYSLGAINFLGETGEYDFVPTESPDFDHWMIWSYDTNLDDVYDYFFGANLTSAAMNAESEEGSHGPGLAVYQDSDGNGEFDADVDEKLVDVDSSDGNTSMDEGTNASALQFEIRQKITGFYEATGITYGDTVKVRMETHSDFGDTTKGKKYTFTLGKVTAVTSEVTDGEVLLSWDENTAADSYQVLLYTKKKKKLAVYKVTSTSKSLTDLAANTTYRFRVRAVTDNGAKGAFSAYKQFTTN
jgi:hypothetical protein